MKIIGNKIIFNEEDFLKGFAPWAEDSLVTKIGPGFVWASEFNPYRYLGYALPGHLYETVTNNAALAGLPIAGDFDGNLLYYLVDRGGSVQQYTVSTNTLLNSGGVFPHAISHGAHSGETGSDALIYRHNISSSLVYSFFYSFYDGTDWDVGVYQDLAGSPAFDDDFMSTIPATPLGTTAADLTDGKNIDHPMIIGQDGLLYIGSGRYLHSFDGTTGANGTFTSKALTLPQNFRITCLAKYNGFLMIGGNYTGVTSGNLNCSVFSWNYTDTVISQEYSLNETAIGTMFLWNGILTVVTTGVKGLTGRSRVKQFNGNNFTIKAEWTQGGLVAYRGYAFKNDQLLLNCSGKIVSIGSPYGQSFEVNHIASASLVADSGGYLTRHPTLDTLLIGCSSNSSTRAFDRMETTSNYTATAEVQSITAEPMFKDDMKGKIEAVKIYFKTTASGGRSLAVALLTDDGGTTTTVFSSATVAAPLIKYLTRDTSNNPFPDFKDLSVNLTWSTGAGATAVPPTISRIEIILSDTTTGA